MAEQNPPNDAEQKTKRKLPLKAILIILGVLLMEGGTIVVFKVFSKPSLAEGSSSIEKTAENPTKDEAEIILAEGFSVDNHMAGHTTLKVTMDIAFKVKKDNKDNVEILVEDHKREMLDRIRTLVAGAQPDHIKKEPDLQVIKREIKLAVEEIIGKELVEDILITDWTTYESGY